MNLVVLSAAHDARLHNGSDKIQKRYRSPKAMRRRLANFRPGKWSKAKTCEGQASCELFIPPSPGPEMNDCVSTIFKKRVMPAPQHSEVGYRLLTA